MFLLQHPENKPCNSAGFQLNLDGGTNNSGDDSTLTGQPKSKEPVDKSRTNMESEEVLVDS